MHANIHLGGPGVNFAPELMAGDGMYWEAPERIFFTRVEIM